MFQQVILTKRFLVEILLLYPIKRYRVEDWAVTPNSRFFFIMISTSTHSVGFSFSLSFSLSCVHSKSSQKCEVLQIKRKILRE